MNNNAFNLFQGELPLTPLNSLVATLPSITYGVSVTANATTGLEITLLLGLSALTWRTIQKMTAILNHQTNNSTQESLEILEQLLSQNSSLFSITEEFYRERAAKSGRPLQQVRAEVAYNTATILLIFSQYKKMIISTEFNVEEKLEKQLQFYQNLREIILPRLSLIYPETKNDIERFLLRMQHLLMNHPHFNILTRTAVQWCSLLIEQCREALRTEKLWFLLNQEINELLKHYQQINLENYPWRETALEDLKQQTEHLLNQFLETLPEEEKQKLLKQYQQYYLEYLNEIGNGDEEYDWTNIESYWNEKDPKIIEAAKRMLRDNKITDKEEKRMKKIDLQRGQKEEYNFVTKQSYLFYRNLPKLIKYYSGLYVWFEDEKVKDFDEDEVVLCGRVIRSDEVQARKINAIYVNQVPTLN